MVEPAIFGPIDAILAQRVGDQLLITHLVLVLVVVNLLTRFLAHTRHARQASEGPEAISRFRLHELSNVVLVLATLYYTTLHHHSGIVLSTLVLGTFIADLFEFEARKVEVREGREIERPKGALVASLIALGYAAYLSLFFVIAPVWNAIV